MSQSPGQSPFPFPGQKAGSSPVSTTSSPAERTAALEAGAQAFLKGDVPQAERVAAQFVKDFPQDPRGWWLFGRVRTLQARFSDAESFLARAWFLRPSDAEIAAARGHLRMRQGKHAESAAFFAEAMRLRPDHPEARFLYAEALRRDGKYREALAEIGDATTPVALHVGGKAKHQLGDLDGAEAALRAALAMDIPPALRAQVELQLGQVLESRGQTSEAFEHFRASRDALPAAFDMNIFEERMRVFRAYFTADRIKRFATPTNLTRRPVFIIGMARSGTTLLEKMIAAHPRGAGTGEISMLPELLRSWQTSPNPDERYPNVLERCDANRLDGIVGAYLAATDVYAGNADRVADKHLANWMHVGFINMVFPKATLVHIERDPMDIGLSAFERLTNLSMPWSANIVNIGRMLATHRWMMDFWHSLLPNRMVRVRYEDLVRDPRTHLGRVLDECELGWDDACLQHERRRDDRETPPPTMAGEQVARRIYDSSIGRASKFATELAPMAKAYEETLARLSGSA